MKIFFKIFYLNCIKHFSFRRFFITIGFFWAVLTLAGVVTFGRILDEIFFRGYKKVKLENPIFIISNPRSGTTYLHYLMSLDKERFSFTLLFHTVFPAVSLIRFFNFLARIDAKTFGWGKKLVDWLDRIMFKGWDGIHRTGWYLPEEDEGAYIYTFITSSVYMLCPFANEMPELAIPDQLPDKVRKWLMANFKSSLQRISYAQGEEKTFLSKNVLSTGKVRALLETFPGARFVYLVRNPLESLPSFMSMFTVPWKVHSPDIPKDSPQTRAWGEIGMEFYEYFDEFRQDLPEEKLKVIAYKDLVEAPYDKVIEVYEHFGLTPQYKFLERLRKATEKARSYKSKHSYSLEEYGLSKAEVKERLLPVLRKYGVEM